MLVATPIQKIPETLVNILLETLHPTLKTKAVCFDRSHVAGDQGLLRPRLPENLPAIASLMPEKAYCMLGNAFN
ncbi:MAG: hypothetical protein O3B13_16860 [Planctomycetota bacterium]|nr:hypothetical protein [Planctomycetota bacterium]MDA1164765.1 hypothetical protein [Planctomycetota bacterium]